MGSGSSPLSCEVFLLPLLLQPFPLLIAGCVLLLLPASVFVYSSCGKWVFPLLLWSFPPSATHKVSRSWLLGACPLSCPLHPGLACLHFREGFPSPPLQHSGHPTLFATCLYFSIAYYSVSLFSLGRGWSLHGAMLIWPRVVCGSSVYHLAHLVVCIFPSCLGTGGWWRPEALQVSPFNMKCRCSA
jgi:hypothetical protein